MPERKLPPPRMPSGQRLQRWPAWEHQPWESCHAYEAFALYRDMGSSRSSARVGKQLGKSAALMERWSVEWSWVKRAAVWDEEQDRLLRLAQREEVLRMNREHSAVGRLMLGKGVERLQMAAAADLAITELIRCVEVGSKLERLARGEVTDISELRGNPDHPQVVEVREIVVKSREEAQAMLTLLERNGQVQ